jgi:two-component sensor histidine kinase
LPNSPSARWRLLPPWADSLRARLALILGLVLAPTIIWSILRAVTAFTSHDDRLAEALRSSAALVSGVQERFVEDTRRALIRLAQSPEVRAFQEPGCSTVLADIAAARSGYRSFMALGQDGVVRCASRLTSVGRSYLDRAWFAQLQGGAGFAVSEVIAGPGSARPTLIAAVPLRSPAFAGALAASIDVGQFSPLTPRLTWPEGATMALLDSSGAPLPDIGVQSTAPTEQLPTAEVTQARMGARLETFVADGQDGIRRVYALAPVANGSLFLLLGLPTGGQLDWLEPEIISGVFAPTLILMLGVTAIWVTTNTLVNRHVRELADAARQWSLGRLDLRPNLADAPRELRDLGASFAQMAGQLAAREAELRASLAHKEVLLKEVHHRVKNNLQIVSSLLSLRTRSARNPPVREALEEVQMRIDALALVHRNLYEHAEPTVVELSAFLSDLGRLLIGGGERDPEGRIRLSVEVEPALIPADRAVPIALLVTELVTNAERHAFPDGRSGLIMLRLCRTDGKARLSVADDGIGPPGPGSPAGLGMTLCRLLAKQIGGQLDISGPPGMTATIEFPALPEPDTASPEGAPDPRPGLPSGRPAA